MAGLEDLYADTPQVDADRAEKEALEHGIATLSREHEALKRRFDGEQIRHQAEMKAYKEIVDRLLRRLGSCDCDC